MRTIPLVRASNYEARPAGERGARTTLTVSGRHPIQMMSGGLTDASVGPIACLLALLALISPRLVLILLWIFSNVLSHAYHNWIVPFLGFFILPWTTLAYAAFWDWGPGHHVTGFEWFFVGLAFVIDLGSYMGGRAARRD